MSEYAQLDEKGNVMRIIVIEPEMLATGAWGDPKTWVTREALPKHEVKEETRMTGNAPK